MLKRIVQTSLATVVHNPGAARIARRHVPSARIIEIPHLFDGQPFPPPAEAMRFRQAHGIPAHLFLFGIFGYLRESKRILSALRAFDRLDDLRSGFVLAGDFISPHLRRAAEPMLRHPRVFQLPYLKERQFRAAVMAVDACINLRYPPAGEASGISIRLMAAGKPVILNDSEENAGFPEDACVRIPSGLEEFRALLAAMSLLTSSRGLSRAIGERAAEHIRARHTAKQAAEQYWKVLCECRQ